MVSVAISVFVIVCMWMIYEKLDLDGWKCLIPFYNSYVLCKRIYKVSAFVVCLAASIIIFAATAWLTVLAIGGLIRTYGISEFMGGLTVANILIPVILITICVIILLVYTVIIYVKLAQAFGKSGAFVIGLIFITPVFLGILALDSGIKAVEPEETVIPEDEVSVQPAEEVRQEVPETEVFTEPTAGEGNKICPYCKAEIAAESKKCPYCRSELD
ncbi:MAG: DUF5684 domain-containing protein [Lachnospiraceae bacterium]|nr:DUF5684 domain-containing protein [Lachnospiraceae bacterium]